MRMGQGRDLWLLNNGLQFTKNGENPRGFMASVESTACIKGLMQLEKGGNGETKARARPRVWKVNLL